MKAVVALDIGTTKLCGLALTSAGRAAAVASREHRAALETSAPGRAEQDPARLLELALDVLRELRPAAPNLAGLGLTGQMHGMLCVDSAGQPLSNLVTWQDGRCLEPARHDGPSWLAEMLGRVPPRTWECCGCRPASGYLGCTLYWLSRSGGLPRGTTRVTGIHDWIAGQLTGRLPVTDASDAGSSGIFDVANLRWHDEIVQALELPPELLPPVLPAGEVLGPITPEVADATGLAPGVQVCNALGDNQASFLGSVARPDRALLVNLGTGGQISWAIPRFRRSPGMETRYLPLGTGRHAYLLVGASLCGGRAYQWLADTVLDWMRALGVTAPPGQTLDRSDVYERLNRLAAEAPQDCGGLRVATTLAGTRSDPGLRGGFLNVGLENFGLGNVSRAILRGIVHELADFHDAAAAQAAARHEVVVAAGNAVRKNPLLPRLIAERFGRPVHVPRHTEEAALGAALLAGTSLGVWPDLETAAGCIEYAST
jgi:sedoheptulokinase